MNGNGHARRDANGFDTGYVGKAHRPKPAAAGAHGSKSPLFPTADEAIAAAGRAVKGGALAAVWTYHRRDGSEAFKVARFDTADGEKEFRPVHRHKSRWRLGDPPDPLPLYGLPNLPDGAIYVTEGEKAADAARALGLPVTTSAHGSSAAAKSDWAPLAGRDVFILPDNDAAGRKYARDVAAILVSQNPPARVRIVELPGLPEGGDVVEFVAARPLTDAETLQAAVRALADAAPVINPADLIGGPVLTCLADIEPREVRWTWRNRIPEGRITLFVGVPGEGKSFTTIDAAARVSTGSPWPDGAPCERGSVILISAEDDPHDTIRPRLDAAGADVSRIHLLATVRRVQEDGSHEEAMFTLADVAALEAALIAQPDCRLIVIDPIGSFLGGRTNSQLDNEVRSVLAPVALLAERHRAAVVIIAHRRKSSGATADELALGSRAFTGIARAVWHISRDKDDKNRRFFLPGKNNLAAQGDGLAFTIAGEPVAAVRWEREPVRMSADDALAADQGAADDTDRPATREQQAGTFIAEYLRDGPRSWERVERAGRKAGHKPATLERARVTVAETFKTEGQRGRWYWRLKGDTRTEPATAPPREPNAEVAEVAEHAFSGPKTGVPDATPTPRTRGIRPETQLPQLPQLPHPPTAEALEDRQVQVRRGLRARWPLDVLAVLESEALAAGQEHGEVAAGVAAHLRAAQ